MRLGFHLSIAGSLRRAVHLAQVLGCQALQIFVQNPRAWKWRPVSPAEIRDFCRARRQAGLHPLVVHLGYLPNLAAADPALYELSRHRLLRELARGPGMDSLKLVHLNDSWAHCHSRRDRHWHLGQGAIGLPGLRRLLSHPWLRPAAAILETPKKHPAHEWYNLLAARSLVAGTPLLTGGETG